MTWDHVKTIAVMLALILVVHIAARVIYRLL